MNDLISRQALCEYALNQKDKCITPNDIMRFPSVQPEPEEFEWCTDCKEYDQTAHCCHRFTKVIRQTVEELKAERKRGEWVLCSETDDLPDHEVLCCDLRGNMLVGYLCTDEGSDTGFLAESDGECLVDCVAWREKPEPWKDSDKE